MVLRSSCACAATAKSDAKPSKDTTTLNFIKPPVDLVFGAGRQNSSATAHFAACLRQGGSYPHLFMFFLVPKDAEREVKVT
jgi:hypothetical protein